MPYSYVWEESTGSVTFANFVDFIENFVLNQMNFGHDWTRIFICGQKLSD